ncbi:MAG: N-acetylmuramic acid 6-phosphate etherase [Candidatus Omnitrophica bacterium]|nr:N-acetylmuramic acid 6-phosphate etherase [Candidatus Omnitrophota bacterium]
MPRAIRYHRLLTEQRHPRSHDLDRLSPVRLLQLMSREDRHVIQAVARCHRPLARAIRVIAKTLQRGGRLVFVGAGTSGRLGVMEAAECPPTFSTRPGQIQAIIAGGREAVFRSREGAEDDRASARRVIRRRVQPGDVVVGISASGVTPFVDAALAAAARSGAVTVLISGHPHPPIPATIRICLAVGPELLTGSTRLKVGTATKLALNMLTLGAMVQAGNTYGNLMVEVRPTSRKLRARAVRIVRTIARCSEPKAVRALRSARGRVNAAILMLRQELTYPAALRHLARRHGSLRRALHDAPTAP